LRPTHGCFGGHFGVFIICSCSCCSRRTPKMKCMFANATFTSERATARSHENRSRGAVLSCRVRWHMRGGMREPYHARSPQQREQRSRFGHRPALFAVAVDCKTQRKTQPQPAPSHQNPQSKPRNPAVKISLLTAIAGQVSTHNNEIF